MKTLTINSTSIKVAENWNELSKKQLISIIKMLFNKDLKLTRSQWQYSILYRTIFNTELFNLKFLWCFLKLPKSDVISLFPLIKWIEKGNTLTDFKLKSFRSSSSTFFAPANGLINITLGEFSFLDPLYMSYKKTNNEDYLNCLVGILYRVKKKGYKPTSANFNGDIRADFNEHLIVRNAKKVRKLSMAKKHMIFLAYEGSRNEIINSCPLLFSSEEKKQTGRNFGYGGLIMEMAGNKFGPHKETAETNLLTAFNFLEMEASKQIKK